MTRSMRPDDWELAGPEVDHVTRWRLVDVCSAAAMATETALKALPFGTQAPNHVAIGRHWCSKAALVPPLRC